MGNNKNKYPSIAKLLLRAGASPDCQDVLDKTVVHYGAGMMATNITLEIVDLCIQAAKTSHLYGRDVVLKGLKSTELNGKVGVLGGFDADTGRRSVYIQDLDREVWVKVENIKLTDDKTSDLYGKHVVLTGLKNEAMNGKRGVVGAFDSSAARHGVCIPELKKEVWIKEDNITVPEALGLNLFGKNVVLSGLIRFKLTIVLHRCYGHTKSYVIHLWGYSFGKTFMFALILGASSQLMEVNLQFNTLKLAKLCRLQRRPRLLLRVQFRLLLGLLAILQWGCLLFSYCFFRRYLLYFKVELMES